jgi:hypothetical protein
MPTEQDTLAAPAAPTAKPTAPTKLTEALQGLKNMTADFSSIEVLTYTGDLKAIVNKDGNAIDWDGLFSKVAPRKEGEPELQGEIKLVAATRVLFDGDTQNFRTAEKLERMDELLKLHDQAVESSRQTRQALIQFFADGLKKLVGG